MHGLLEVNSFAIYLLEPDGKRLAMAFSIEGDKPLPIEYVDLSDPDSNSARCIRERCELLCDLDEDNDASIIPNTFRTLTALFSPLTIGDRQIGVITVQSLKRNAYTDRDRLIFGTLSAYAAIAINNAQTYQELQETQKKLLAQEKMAALGSLVAGVAHELNTPISNSILLASTMSHKTEVLDKKLSDNKMRRSDLLNYLKESKEASSLNLHSLQNAADLVDSFKQIAVDRTAAHRRLFDIKQLTHDIMATMMNQLQKINVIMDVNISDNIVMDSYPGPLGQVVMNLISNTLRHAFIADHGGKITLSARQTNDAHIEIQFADNGSGISPENLQKIFDPFFTTKLGQGGSGLGLSISYNIVTSILNGHISAQSTLGNGATFTLKLPLVVPT
jgi:signal transduction histidine kinase